MQGKMKKTLTALSHAPVEISNGVPGDDFASQATCMYYYLVLVIKTIYDSVTYLRIVCN